MAGELVVSAAAGIALVGDSTAARVHLDRWPSHVADGYIAAYRMDIQMAVANVSQSDRPGKSFHVQVGIADVRHFDRGRSSFENYIAAQSLCPEGSVGRTQ